MKTPNTVLVNSIPGIEIGTLMTIVEGVNDYEFIPGKL